MRPAITFLNIQGLYLLTYRISKIEDVESRKNKYYLFDQPEYTELYNNREKIPYSSKIAKINYYLLKKGKYERAIFVVKFRGCLYKLIRKAVEKSAN